MAYFASQAPLAHVVKQPVNLHSQHTLGELRGVYVIPSGTRSMGLDRLFNRTAVNLNTLQKFCTPFRLELLQSRLTKTERFETPPRTPDAD